MSKHPATWSFGPDDALVQRSYSLRKSGFFRSVFPEYFFYNPPSSKACPGLPSLSSIFQASITTFQNVPKGARDSWAKVFSDCLVSVMEDPVNLSSWSKVVKLAKCVLASPATGHRLSWREMLKLAKSRIQRWLAGDLVALWSEAVDEGQSLSRRMQLSSSSSQLNRNIRRAKRAVQYSKAIKSLTSDGLSLASAEVLQEMLTKHPQTAPPSLPVTLPVSVTESVVRKAAKSFPNGSAPGPSGLRPIHLREAVGCPSRDKANRILASLTKFVNLLAAGQVPSFIIPHLCGATLLACKKKKGGHRPIAVGEV